MLCQPLLLIALIFCVPSAVGQKVLWQINTPFDFALFPDGHRMAYVADQRTNFTLFSIDVTTGAQQWVADLNMQPMGDIFFSNRGGLLVPTYLPSGGMYRMLSSFDGSSGNLLWSTLFSGYVTGMSGEYIILQPHYDSDDLSALNTTTKGTPISWSLNMSRSTTTYVPQNAKSLVWQMETETYIVPINFYDQSHATFHVKFGSYMGDCGNLMLFANNDYAPASFFCAYSIIDNEVSAPWCADLNFTVRYASSSEHYIVVSQVNAPFPCIAVLNHTGFVLQQWCTYVTTSTLLVAGGTVILSFSDRILGLSATTGEEQWKINVTVNLLAASPAGVLIANNAFGIMMGLQIPLPIAIAQYSTVDCSGYANVTRYPSGCTNSGTAASILRTCDAKQALLIQFFGQVNCAGQAIENQKLHLNQCLPSVSGTSQMLQACQP